MKKKCTNCNKELEINKRNFVLINYGNEYAYTSVCRECIKGGKR